MTLDQIRLKTYLLTSTSGVDDFPDDILVAEANNALERVTSLIFQASGRWQWVDTNDNSLAIATTDLKTDQQDYSLEVTHLEVTRMEVKDQQGDWHKLIPIDQADVTDTSLTDYLKTSSLPVYYDKIGKSVFLYPKPNYDQDDSLKLYFMRGPSYFVTTDTDKTPGFNLLYHDLIPLWISYNFAIANGKSNSQALMTEITTKEDALKEDYALRSRDEHIGLRTTPRSWR